MDHESEVFTGSLVDGVAEAIENCLLTPSATGVREIQIIGTPEQVRATYRSLAIAALEAARVPSDLMVKAGEGWQAHSSDTDTLYSEMMKVAIHGYD